MAAPAVVNAASQTNASASTAAVTLPGSLVVGNLLLVWINTRGTTNTFSIAPGEVGFGWTVIASSVSSALAWKIIDGSESATLTFTWGSAATSASLAVQVSGTSVAPIEGNAAAENAASTSVTATAVTAKWGADLLLTFYTVTNASGITVAGGQSNIGGTTGNSRSIILGYETLSATGTTGTRVGTCTSATNIGLNVLLREPATTGIVIVNTVPNGPKKIQYSVAGIGAGAVVGMSVNIGPYYGRYKILGTVKQSGTNAPLSRPVFVFDKSSKRLLRATRSALDGTYCVANVSAQVHNVLAIDDTEVENSVVAARVTPVAM